MQANTGVTVRQWDAPVRIVHWAFVMLMPALWWSAENSNLALHRTLGCVMLALIMFRILWGIFGSSTARFVSFVKGPSAVIAYMRTVLRKSDGVTIGHNPLGAMSVIALLGLLAAQVSFGLFAQDVDGIESGPLSFLVTYEGADLAREWHHLLFNILCIVVAIHMAAILFYLFFKRDNLIRPMVTGKKQLAVPAAEMISAPIWRVVVIAIFSSGFAFWIAQGAHWF